MTAVLYILIAAAAGLALAKALRLPAVPLLVVAGVVMHLIGAAPAFELLQDTVILGLAFLVFFAGTELNPNRVGKQQRNALIVGLVQFFTIALVGVIAALLLGLTWQASLYLGLALTASSTLVVVNILRQRQQFFEPFGRLVLGVLLLQDLLVVVAIGGLSGVDHGLVGVLWGLGATLGMIVLAYVNARWVAPWVIGRLNLDEESLLLVVLAVLFAFIGLAHLLDLPLVVGALLAGVSLSGFPVQGLVRGQVNSLGDFFLAVFFVTLGALLDWPSWGDLLLAALLIILILGITPPLVAWTARWVGLPNRVGIESGLLLAQCSEFSLVVALLGASQGHLKYEEFNLIAIVTVLTMILTPFFATSRNTWLLMQLGLRRAQRDSDRAARPEGHVLLLGCGRTGEQLVHALRERGQRVVVVDDDWQVMRRLREAGVEVVPGDGADYIVLRDAGARAAKVIVSTMRRVEDTERMLRFVWEAGVPVLARSFGVEDAQRLAVLGAEPVVESDLAAQQTLAWFDQRFGSAQKAGDPA